MMGKLNLRSKSKKNQRTRLSSNKRKQDLEDATLGESKVKAFENYEKVKRILDIGSKITEREQDLNQSSGLMSPHFYKPQKNKLFYIPKTNKLNKNPVKVTDKFKDNGWVRESTNDQMRRNLYTEVNSPVHQLEFERPTSPNDKNNFRILSTKHTTEETDEASHKVPSDLFSKTLNKAILKDFSLNGNKMQNKHTYNYLMPPEILEKEDSFQS